MKSAHPSLTVCRNGWLAALRRAIFQLVAMLSAPVALATGLVDGGFNSPTGWRGIAIEGSTVNDLHAMVVQPDRKIVLAGTCRNGADFDFCVTRLTTHGALDSSFVGPTGNADGRFKFAIGSSDDKVSAVALQADGKIVLAGSCLQAGVNNFCLARLNSDGSFDTTFNGPNAAGTGTGNGQGRFMLRVAATGHELASAIAIQPDGKLVLAGSCKPDTRVAICVARLNLDGSFDADFDGPDNNGNGRFFRYFGGGDASVSAVAVHNDGHIFVVGTCNNAGSGLDFCAVKLRALDGHLNTGFGTAGVVQIPMTSGGGSDYASSLAFTHRGEMLIAGSCSNGGHYEFCLVRLLASNGAQSYFPWVGNTKLFRSAGSGDDYVTGIVVQPDGKIVLSGFCQDGTSYRFCAARYFAEGGIDQLFFGGHMPAQPDGGSLLVPPMLSNDQANALAIQLIPGATDGYHTRLGLLLAGNCVQGTVTQFCVTRFVADLMESSTCSMDVDGDGRMLATVDGLIMTRVMLGLRDNQVIQGINFPADAVRSSWVAIQRYLSRQCGIALPPDFASQ